MTSLDVHDPTARTFGDTAISLRVHAAQTLHRTCDGLWRAIADVDGGSRLIHETGSGSGAPVIASTTYGYGLRALGGDSRWVAATTTREALMLRRLGEAIEIATPPGWRCGDPTLHAGELLIAADAVDAPIARLLSLRPGAAAITLIEAPFLARPTVSPNGDWIAWLEWAEPWMPWQRAAVRVARRDSGLIGASRAVSPADSGCAQPAFAPDGALWFLCDAGGASQLWRWTPRGGARRVTDQSDDIGLPSTTIAGASYAFAGSGRVIALWWHGGRAAVVAFAADDGREIARLRPPRPVTDQIAVHDGQVHLCATPGGDPEPRPAEVWIGAAPAWYWPPRTDDGCVLIELHGGPTGMVPPVLSAPLRAHIADGHGVLALNYRGSSGYGSKHRRALDGAWGLADVEDVLGAIVWLAGKGVAESRVVLRGASAGAFTALCVAARGVRLGGVIARYAVADLAGLARATHRFERGYLLTLTGAASADAAVLVERSPIHRAEAVRTPLLLLHGDADAVTPLDQIAAFAHAVLAAGGEATLAVQPGEGHGFKQRKTEARCVALERGFVRRLQR